PFFTTKGKNKGTGLGLSVVHGTVVEHEGTIAIEDVDGGGTRFRITLPMANLASMGLEMPSDNHELQMGNAERVLVIEDEESVRAGLVQMLEILGYEPVAVASGEAALSLGSEGAFDVLVTDFVLPGLTGPEVAQQLVSRWPSMRTVLMSGYVSDPDIRASASAGNAQFLEKPFDVRDLGHALSTALGQNGNVH